MRCMACGESMRLIRVEPDLNAAVAGFMTHTMKCSGCGDTEQRRVFNRPFKIELFHQAPPVAVVDAADLKEGEDALRQAMEKVSSSGQLEARSAWMRTVAKLRGKPDGDT
jgi:predicted metalloprotease